MTESETSTLRTLHNWVCKVLTQLRYMVPAQTEPINTLVYNGDSLANVENK